MLERDRRAENHTGTCSTCAWHIRLWSLINSQHYSLGEKGDCSRVQLDCKKNQGPTHLKVWKNLAAIVLCTSWPKNTKPLQIVPENITDSKENFLISFVLVAAKYSTLVIKAIKFVCLLCRIFIEENV